MKKIISALLFISIAATVVAQETEEDPMKGKFRQDNIFIGGSIGLSLGGWGSGFSVGANPEVGYSIANWLDAGVAFNYNYFSYKAEYNYGVRQRSTTLGAGVFTRVFPVRSVFLQIQPEYNTITTNLRDFNYSPAIDDQLKQQAPSLLLGVGYGTRVIGGGSFYTVIMIDAGNNKNSPYISYDGTKLPILRTGFNFYLKPRRQK